MNDYYTLQGLRRMCIGDDEVEEWIRDSVDGQAGRRPQATIPRLVADALEQLLQSGEGSWAVRASQAFSVLPKEWRAFDRVLAAVDGKSVGGRALRKKVSRAATGLMVGGKLPIRIAEGQERVVDLDYLVLQVGT